MQCRDGTIGGKGLLAVEPAAEKLLKAAMQQLYLSASAYHRVLKLARTIADLAESEVIAVQTESGDVVLRVGEALCHDTYDEEYTVFNIAETHFAVF